VDKWLLRAMLSTPVSAIDLIGEVSRAVSEQMPLSPTLLLGVAEQRRQEREQAAARGTVQQLTEQ